MSVDFSSRWAWADVRIGAIRDNVRSIADMVAPAEVWAVVKANGYGHGSVPVAQIALNSGATGLCVALVDEGVVLRRAGAQHPILLLSEQPSDQAAYIVGYGLTPTITTTMGAAAIGAAAAQQGKPAAVHLKIDTGMHRVGASPQEAVHLARFIHDHEGLDLEGVYTHFAVADDPSHPANAAQLTLFHNTLDAIRQAGISPRIVHAANSAAALANSDARFNMVRLGIAMYGLRPGPGVAHLCGSLKPAMELKARVSAVRWIDDGEAVSYGLRRPVSGKTLIATVPLGYADGVPRSLWSTGLSALINGKRRPYAGTITMDQLMLDCGQDASVAVGDEVVLFGAQGDEFVGADDWADALGTIGYEIACGISGRIFRRYE